MPTEYWAYAGNRCRGKFKTELDAMECLIMDPQAIMSIYLVILDNEGRVLQEPVLHWGTELRE